MAWKLAGYEVMVTEFYQIPTDVVVQILHNAGWSSEFDYPSAVRNLQEWFFDIYEITLKMPDAKGIINAQIDALTRK